MKTILTIILICIFANGYGQNPFNKTYGWSKTDGSAQIVNFSKNRFLFSITTEYQSNKYHSFLMLLHKSGDKISGNLINNKVLEINTIKYINSGQIINSGFYNINYAASVTDVLLQKTDTFNSEIWIKHYGGSGMDYGNDIELLSDSGFIIVGTTESYGAGANDVYIIRTDKHGDSLWTRTFGQSGGEIAKGIEPINDSVFYVCGTTTSFGAQWSDVFVMKLNDLGDTSFLNIYGNWGNDVANAMVKTQDKGYAIAGWELYNTSLDGEFLLLKIDSNANQLFLKTYGYQGMDEAFDIKECYDHGFIMVGYSEQPGRGEDVYIVRTDSVGDTLWTKTLGGAYNDRAYSVVQTPDSGFAVVGNTYSYGAGGSDAFFLKLKSNGDITTAIGLPVEPVSSKMQLSPNPANSTTTINFGKPQSGLLIIYGIDGKIIKKINVFAKESINIDVNTLNNGIYILKFTNEQNGSCKYAKLIVQ